MVRQVYSWPAANFFSYRFVIQRTPQRTAAVAMTPTIANVGPNVWSMGGNITTVAVFLTDA